MVLSQPPSWSTTDRYIHPCDFFHGSQEWCLWFSSVLTCINSSSASSIVAVGGLPKKAAAAFLSSQDSMYTCINTSTYNQLHDKAADPPLFKLREKNKQEDYGHPNGKWKLNQHPYKMNACMHTSTSKNVSWLGHLHTSKPKLIHTADFHILLVVFRLFSERQLCVN